MINTLNEIKSLDSLRKIMKIYISKSQELISELNKNINLNQNNELTLASDNYLINRGLNNKINVLQSNVATIIDEYMKIDIILSTNVNFYSSLDQIKSNLLPKLVMAISNKNNQNAKKENVVALREIYKLLDYKKINKLKVNFNNIIETTNSKKNEEIITIPKLDEMSEEFQKEFSKKL